MTELTAAQEPAAVRPVAVSRETSVEALYDAEYDRLTAYAVRLVGDRDAARDVVQEAFARLLTRWVGVREPVPYLYHVVTNLGRDRWSGRRRQLQLLDRLKEPPRHLPGPDVAVRDAVSRLPRGHRDVVLLYYFGDLPVPEVAAIVRRPPGTVKRLLSEARAALAASLGAPDA